MRLHSTLILALGALAGGVSGYALGSAEVIPGTYYIDIDQAMEQVPSFNTMREKRMAPVQKLGAVWQEKKAKLEEDAATFALLEEGTEEFVTMQVDLAIREESLKAELDLLNDSARQVNEGLAFEAQRLVQAGVEKLGSDKGYEHIVLRPLRYAEFPWEESPNTAREMLRNRDTFWVHPDRDLTPELVEILNAAQ